MTKPSNSREKHQQTVDELVKRLERKRHGELKANITYTRGNVRGNPIGELDVVHNEWRNGRQYITYYEVKTGSNLESAMDKAWEQAQTFFKHYPAAPGARKNVVYVHKDYGVIRWSG